MAFFIHCNNCLVLNNEEQLYMLSCQHMFCKGCMQNSGKVHKLCKNFLKNLFFFVENGKICPMCKQNVRVLEISKLPDDVKYNFHPIEKILQRPAKAIKFRQSHQINMLKLTINYKNKCIKAEKAYNQLKQETMRMKQQLDKLAERRKLMHSKLKQIYLSNQKKKPSQVYRSQANSFSTSDSPATLTPRGIVNRSTESSFFGHSEQNLIGKYSSRLNTPA
jgi:zinc-RING finger domain